MAARIRTVRCAAAWAIAAALAVGGAVCAPLAHGDDILPLETDTPPATTTTLQTNGATATTTTGTTPPAVAAAGSATVEPAAVGAKPAVRLPAIQVTDTLPAPTFTTTGPGDSLEIPANSGSGRRVVYSKSIMRVWLIEEDGTVFDTHRVSGRMDQPKPGTYAVWSRSPTTCSRLHSNICMRFMVRFAWSFRGDNIGFHEIPRRDGVPMQDVSQLGLSLSGGCVRQATDDAIIMWNWAQIGTVVVVMG